MRGEERGQIPRPWPFLLISAGAALWIDLGSLHRGQHADSLLPVLISLQRWTPFFWEQDRYGMLIPWLARPWTHPFANLLVQGFLNVSCGLSAFFLLARYMVREASYPIVGALGATAFLILAPAPYRFDYLMDANYGVWLSLGLGGLLAAESGGGEPTWGRRLVALGLMVLAHWVYCAAALYLGPLVVFRALLAPDVGRDVISNLRPRHGSGTVKELRGVAVGIARTETGRAILLISAGFAAGMALSRLTPHHQTSFAALAPRDWPHAWAALVERTWRALAPGAWPIALGLGAVLVPIACLLRDRDRRPSIPWRGAAALVLTALVVALFMGTRSWLRTNEYAPRYLLPSALLVQAALTMLIVVPLCGGRIAGGRRMLPAVVAPLLLLGAATGYGLPSPGRVRADLDRSGALTEDLLAARCTHLAGDYWTVWPAIFHAHLVLRERGEQRPLWGVTFRGQPASVFWWGTPLEGRRVGIPRRDPFGENWLQAFGMARFQDVERRRTLRVLRWRKPTSAEDQRP